MDNQKNQSGPRSSKGKVKKFFRGMRKKIRAKLGRGKICPAQEQQMGGTSGRADVEEQQGTISQGSSNIINVASSESEVGRNYVHLEMTPSMREEIEERFQQRDRAKKFFGTVEDLRGTYAQKQEKRESVTINMEEPTNIPDSSHKKAKKKVRFQSPPASDTEETENQEFHQERAKTVFKRVELIRAKLVQESFHQLEEQQRRDSEVKVAIEEQESTVTVDDSMWVVVKGRMSKFSHISEFARRILEHGFFSKLIIFLIMLYVLLLTVKAEISDKPDLYTVTQVLVGINWVIFTVFFLEVLLKMMENFRQFWRCPWNIFDLFLVILTVLPEIISLVSGVDPGVVKLLRTLRILHVLKIMSKFRQMRLTMLALVKAYQDLGPVFMLLFIVMYIFAVTGKALFRKFADTTVPDLTYKDSFEGVGNTFSTLFIVFTYDHWYCLLKDAWKVPELNAIACTIYVFLWLIIAGFIFRNLVVGFMVSNFQTIRSEFTKEVHQIEMQQKADLFKADIIAEKESLEEMDDEASTSTSASSTSQKQLEVDWETMVLQNMQVIMRQEEGEEVLWPREELFKYFEKVEELQRVLEERKQLHNLFVQAHLNLHET